MSILPDDDRKVEFTTKERVVHNGDRRRRIVHPVIRVYNSLPRREIPMISGRWEGRPSSI